jgi:hypothetical protein
LIALAAEPASKVVIAIRHRRRSNPKKFIVALQTDCLPVGRPWSFLPRNHEKQLLKPLLFFYRNRIYKGFVYFHGTIN